MNETTVNAMNAILEGKVIETYDRYYKIDAEKNQIVYSDERVVWKPSVMVLNDFLKSTWRIVD